MKKPEHTSNTDSEHLPENKTSDSDKEGLSYPQIARRIFAAALNTRNDRTLRDDLTTLLDSDTPFIDEVSTDSMIDSDQEILFAARAQRLKANLRNTTLTIARESAFSTPAPRPASTDEPLAVLLGHALTIGRALLTLPCFAPAAAAPVDDLQIQRQTIQTGDGVRIEFQQLPGGSPSRLRVFVDASRMSPGSGESKASAVSCATYNVAYLTLEESGDDSLHDSVPSRHVLIVPLNDEVCGYADFAIGGIAVVASGRLPAPRGVCHLISATLSHIPSPSSAF